MRDDVPAVTPDCDVDSIQEHGVLSWLGTFLQPASSVNKNVTLG
ncbi:hypothetical protein RESH_03319 [Rhodopirellula europaea SH398]|uniref:Uncharacterized protein n=1 Tax=Rhodopirellula europaea SH398 TaxID=1263868 RepID=M5S3J8_9BACT|nr:hypothetical protein RESH_03319 [Rhodopirellula europaea SH398]